MRLLQLAFLFCGGIELLQVPLPTRHARLSDFVIDVFGSCFAIGLVFVGDKLVGRSSFAEARDLKFEIWASELDRPRTFDALDSGFGSLNIAAPENDVVIVNGSQSPRDNGATRLGQ
jgi:hypothetical protein